jgi:hypothetical protein
MRVRVKTKEEFLADGWSFMDGTLRKNGANFCWKWDDLFGKDLGELDTSKGNSLASKYICVINPTGEITHIESEFVVIFSEEPLLEAQTKKEYPWNVKDGVVRAFWDVDQDSAVYKEEITSLKERLAHPQGVRLEDGLASISQGLAMIMDELEKK